MPRRRGGRPPRAAQPHGKLPKATLVHAAKRHIASPDISHRMAAYRVRRTYRFFGDISSLSPDAKGISGDAVAYRTAQPYIDYLSICSLAGTRYMRLRLIRYMLISFAFDIFACANMLNQTPVYRGKQSVDRRQNDIVVYAGAPDLFTAGCNTYVSNSLRRRAFFKRVLFVGKVGDL